MRIGSLLMVAVAAALLVAGCSEVIIVTPAKFKQPQSAPLGPPKVPKLLYVTPNVGDQSLSTPFAIEAVNLLPSTPAVVHFGAVTFNGMTNASGSRIEDPMGPGGLFSAPPGTGVVDLEVFVTGQNPPTLQLPNAFYYLPPGSPAMPTVTSMAPNASDEFGGGPMVFTGTNVPIGAGYQIVVSFLFSSGTLNIVAQQTFNDSWTILTPAVPAAETFTAGQLQVSVTVNFSAGGLPIPIIVAPPQNPNDGNPFRYNASASPPDPDPTEFVFASGLYGGAVSASNIRESYIRSVSLYEEAPNRLTNAVNNMTDRFMYNGASRLTPNGTHYYPSPLMNSGASFREGNSIFAHFDLPQFNRKYAPAPTVAVPQPNPVTKPVTAHLYHCTNSETGSSATGTQDALFAAYSNGEFEYFEIGPSAQIWEEIHIHEQFSTLPFFAVAYDTANPRLYVCRMDGNVFIGSGKNNIEINMSGVAGKLQGLSLCMAGLFLYFNTDLGNVYRTPLDSATSGVPPIAQACAWPATGSHTIVSDQMSLSGDGTTICFIAGTGNQRWDNFAQAATPPSTQDVYAIRNANQGNSNIIAVTNFAATTGGTKQLVFWNLGDAATSTYGSLAVDSGGNDRRVYMAGINNFAGANRPGSDVVVNFSGTLCAFVARENRSQIDAPNSDAIVNFLYVARIDQNNQMVRVNSATTNSFGLGNYFHRDMTFVPGFWFPRKIPNNAMDRRLVFTCAGIAGGVQGADQHLFTLDLNISGVGLSLAGIADRSVTPMATPFKVDASLPGFNYFGAFPSLGGTVLFVIETKTGLLQYLDLRDGVTSVLQNIKKAHSQADVVLPNNNTKGDVLENTYLPSGFASDPLGSQNVEHWGNQIRSLHGPGLSPFSMEYLMFVSEETPGAEDIYVLQMSGLANPLPSDAINITNIPSAGAIKLFCPSKDGGVMAVVKGPNGYPFGYFASGAVDGWLYVVNDVVGSLGANMTTLTNSATQVVLAGSKYSRGMEWHQTNSRYTLYFGEGSSVPTAPNRPQSLLRFSRLDLDRINNNAISNVEQIRPGGNPLADGAVYVYGVGKRE